MNSWTSAEWDAVAERSLTHDTARPAPIPAPAGTVGLAIALALVDAACQFTALREFTLNGIAPRHAPRAGQHDSLLHSLAELQHGNPCLRRIVDRANVA